MSKKKREKKKKKKKKKKKLTHERLSFKTQRLMFYGYIQDIKKVFKNMPKVGFLAYFIVSW